MQRGLPKSIAEYVCSTSKEEFWYLFLCVCHFKILRRCILWTFIMFVGVIYMIHWMVLYGCQIKRFPRTPLGIALFCHQTSPRHGVPANYGVIEWWGRGVKGESSFSFFTRRAALRERYCLTPAIHSPLFLGNRQHKWKGLFKNVNSSFISWSSQTGAISLKWSNLFWLVRCKSLVNFQYVSDLFWTFFAFTLSISDTECKKPLNTRAFR